MIIIIWLMLSSFLFCRALRYPQSDKPLMSQCDSCKRKLHLLDKIPLLSYIVLRGRCRNCHTKISSLHFIAELLGLLIGLVFTLFPHTIKAHLYVSILFTLFFTDWLHQLIPDRFHFFLILLNIHAINKMTLFIMLLVSLVLLIFVKKGYFGMGDVKLMVSSTLHLSITHVNCLVLIASSITLVLMMITKKAQFPFGSSWAVSLILLNHLI